MACLSCIKTEAGVLLSYNGNFEKLREEFENLSCVRTSVLDQIEEAEVRGGTRVDPVVERWLTRASSLIEEASKIIEQEDRETERRCLMGLRLNLLSCYLASKSAKRLIDDAVQLREAGIRLDRVASIDYSQCLAVTPIPGFLKFESRAYVSNKIVAALKDPTVSMVGVYGMSGTGKTTLAKMIGEDLYLDGTFHAVVMVLVLYKPDLNKIQQKIADKLRIKLDAKTERGRALQLMEGLGKREKLLIILDDIWDRLELEDVGIPRGGRHIKFLITSRIEMILSHEMDCTHTFGLSLLAHHDARTLFDQNVGGVDPSCLSIAAPIVDYCTGLPIIIVIVARALRDSDVAIWEEALMHQKTFDGDDFDIVGLADRSIEVSYNFLSNDEIKKVFLLCGQLMCPDGISIQDLLKYTIGLGLFKNCQRLEQVRNRLYKYLRDLKVCCLLQDGNREGTVIMHDVVRKFAIFVASRDHHVFALTAYDLYFEEWPSNVELEYFTSISLCYCPKLPPGLPPLFNNRLLESFLLLRKDDDPSLRIPDNFFAGLTGLKLVGLTRMSLLVLPSSLNSLVKIRTLCLDFCEWDDINMIGELPMLQVLSLRGSTIVYLPGQIRNLTRLMLLDLCDCSELKGIAKGVLSELTLLEDLYMKNSFNQWEEEVEEGGGGCGCASLGELRNLRKLCRLVEGCPSCYFR